MLGNLLNAIGKSVDQVVTEYLDEKIQQHLEHNRDIIFEENGDRAPKTVTLAYQGPITGDNAATGQSQLNAVKYAIKVFNAKQLKYKVELTEVDDKGDATEVAKVVPQIANNKSIIGIIGPAYSGATVASLPYYKNTNMPLISPSATRTSLTDPTSKTDYGYPVFHRLCFTDETQAKSLANFAIKGITSPKVYVIDDTSPYATYISTIVKTQLKASVVGFNSVPADTKDYSVTIDNIKSIGANVVIYTGEKAIDAANLIKQIRGAKLTVTFVCSDCAFNKQFITTASTAAAEGTKVVGVANLQVVNPTMSADYKTKMKLEAGIYAVEAIDATNIFLAGINGGITTKEKMLNYINTKPFTSAVNKRTIKFDTTGDTTIPNVSTCIVKNGKFVFQKA